MKILLINNLFGDNARGGAEAVVMAEARSLMAAGHQVAVLRSAPADGQTDWQGVPVISVRPAGQRQPYQRLDRISWPGRLSWHWDNLSGTDNPQRVMGALDGFQPDLVHTHNLMGLGFRLSRLLAEAGLPHLHTLHDVQLLHPSGQLPAGTEARLSWAARLYARSAAEALGSPAAVVSPSRFLLDQHRRFGFFPESRLERLFNPVDDTGCRDRLPPEKPIFLFVGQLEEHKGIRLLLKAWQGWVGAEQAELRIAGQGRLREEVKMTADQAVNVRMIGYLSKRALQDAYQEAAYLILPSIVLENSPMAAAEALVHGTPVAAALNGGLPELVREGETGFLFAPNDRCALRDAMNRALAAWQGQQWTALSMRAQSLGKTMTIDRHCDRLLQLYEEIKKSR